MHQADLSQSGPGQERDKGDLEVGYAAQKALHPELRMSHVQKCENFEVQGSKLVRKIHRGLSTHLELAFLEIPTADSAYPKSAKAGLGDCEETSGREPWLVVLSRTCHVEPAPSETYSTREGSVTGFSLG